MALLVTQTSRADSFTLFALLFQGLLIVLFVATVNFPATFNAVGNQGGTTGIAYIYTMLTDIMVMVIFGYTLLHTFFRKYSMSSAAFTFLTVAFSVQWLTLLVQYYSKADFVQWTWIELNISSIIQGFYGATAILVSLGAVIGRVSPLQILWLIFWEGLWYGFNIYICIFTWQAVDSGGCNVIHLFGAAFGLAYGVTLLELKKDPAYPEYRYGRPKNDPDVSEARYNSSIFSALGSLALFVFWPSFNAALANSDFQTYVVTNTVSAMVASVVGAMLFGKIFRRHAKFDMQDMTRATLAGGIVLASGYSYIVSVADSMGAGFTAGVLSAFASTYCVPYLAEQWGVFDSVGVFAGHLVPALLGGSLCTVAVKLSSLTPDLYVIGTSTYATIYPNTTSQWKWQIGMMFVSLLMGLVGGALTGLSAWFFGIQGPNHPLSDMEYMSPPHREFDCLLTDDEARMREDEDSFRAFQHETACAKAKAQ